MEPALALLDAKVELNCVDGRVKPGPDAYEDKALLSAQTTLRTHPYSSAISPRWMPTSFAFKALGDRAAAAVADDEAAVGGLDFADRGHDGRRAAGEGLADPAARRIRPPRVIAVALLAHGPALAPGERDDRIRG